MGDPFSLAVMDDFQMARAAMIAKAKLAAKEGDADFYRAKIATSSFYAHHVLPLAGSYSHAVVKGAESVVAMGEAQF